MLPQAAPARKSVRWGMRGRAPVYRHDMGAERLDPRRPRRSPPPAEREPAEERPAEQVLALQRGAGNHAVAQLIGRVPNLDPRTLADRNPQWAEGKGGTKPAPEHASRSDALSYEHQPAALREVLERSFGETASSWFLRQSDEARSNLVYTYNRMIAYGIWEHVRAIKRLEAGEKPVSLGPLQLVVAGKSQSVVFEVYDGRALRDTMLESQGEGESPAFGKDVGPAGALHPGQTSMREFTLTTRDGLHLSIGVGTEADAHMDRVSPTNAPKGQTSQMDLVRSLEHHWQEVWPEFLRLTPGWLVRVPAARLQLARRQARARRRRAAAPRPAARHPRGVLQRRRARRRAPRRRVGGDDVQAGEQGGAPGSVAARARHGLRRAQGVPLRERRPSRAAALERAARPGVDGRGDDRGGRPGDRAGRPRRRAADRARPARRIRHYADARTLGLAMAGKILAQAKARGIAIGVELGPLYHDLKPAEVADVKVQLDPHRAGGARVARGGAAGARRRGPGRRGARRAQRDGAARAVPHAVRAALTPRGRPMLPVCANPPTASSAPATWTSSGAPATR